MMPLTNTDILELIHLFLWWLILIVKLTGSSSPGRQISGWVVREFLQWVNWTENTHLKCVWHYSMARGPRQNKKEMNIIHLCFLTVDATWPDTLGSYCCVIWPPWWTVPSCCEVKSLFRLILSGIFLKQLEKYWVQSLLRKVNRQSHVSKTQLTSQRDKLRYKFSIPKEAHVYFLIQGMNAYFSYFLSFV